MTVIDLSATAPRDYQHTIEAALVRAGYADAAQALHAAHPRDLLEMWPLLPAEVTITLEEANDARAYHHA